MWKDIVEIKKGERTKTACMFLYFFIIIASYWFLKPLRSELTLDKLGADAIRQLKVITALVSAGVVIIYSISLTRLSREKLAHLILGTFLWLLLFFWFFFTYYGVIKIVYYCFYVFLDLFITVNVALFWTYLADIMTPEGAKRLYGLIGAGGVIGGFLGSFTCKYAVSQLVTPAHMLLYVAGAYSTLILVVAVLGIRTRKDRAVPTGVIAQGRGSRLHDALEGARLIIHSKYFLGICAVLALYEFTSTVNDYTFHKAVELTYHSQGKLISLLVPILHWLSSLLGLDVITGIKELFGLDIGAGSYGVFFSEFFLLVNLVALLVQVMVTSVVIRKFGMTSALLFLPVVIAGLSLVFLIVPVFLFAQLLYLSDNSLNYSINQTSREMLFVPVPRRAKYKAMAFIDMFVLRAAKAGAGFFLLALPFIVSVKHLPDLRWYMPFTIATGFVSIGIAVYLGRRFSHLTRQPSKQTGERDDTTGIPA